MCSILGILDIKTGAAGLREQALEMSKTMRHRGPDWSGIYVNEEAILVHERLSIVDVENGAQPLMSADGRLALAVNGEAEAPSVSVFRILVTGKFLHGSI